MTDICNENYGESFGRHVTAKKNKMTSPRLKRLAEPKYGRHSGPVRISIQRSGAAQRRGVTIYRKPYRCSNRLEQLALPTVRKLITNREMYKCLVGRYWLQRFNKNIYKSMFTIYSRLANLNLPEARNSPKKWTKEQWDAFAEWAATRARPKKHPKPEKIKRTHANLDDLASGLAKLSKPKHPRTKFTKWPETPIVSEAAKKYTPSDRIVQLAAPSERYMVKPPPECPGACINPSALTAKPTDRINEISKPKKSFAVEEPPENKTKYGVAVNALKYVATERIIQLAQPKDD